MHDRVAYCVSQMRRSNVCEVTTTQSSVAPTQQSDAVKLRVNVYDALATAKGYKTVESQAEWHGVHRSTMFRLREGRGDTSLSLAMRMAADLGTQVEVLFERVA